MPGRKNAGQKNGLFVLGFLYSVKKKEKSTHCTCKSVDEKVLSKTQKREPVLFSKASSKRDVGVKKDSVVAKGDIFTDIHTHTHTHTLPPSFGRLVKSR